MHNSIMHMCLIDDVGGMVVESLFDQQNAKLSNVVNDSSSGNRNLAFTSAILLINYRTIDTYRGLFIQCQVHSLLILGSGKMHDMQSFA